VSLGGQSGDERARAAFVARQEAPGVVEHKRAERLVALLSFALNHVREAAFLMDETARFHYVNTESCRLLGYSQGELLGMTLGDIDPDFPVECWIRHWTELKSGGSLIFEGRHRAKDGHVFPVEINANYLEYDGHEYNLALVRDITERKRADAALQEERRLFVGGPNVAFKWRAAAGWPVEYVSPNVTDQFGFAPADLVGGRIPYASIVHPDDLQRVTEEVKAHTEANEPFFEQEYRIKRADGEYRWIYDFTVVLRDPNGLVTHYHGQVRDVTEHKRAERALAEVTKRFISAFEDAQVGMAIVSLNARYTEANQAFCKMLGYSREQLCTKSIPDVTHPDDRAADTATFQSQLRGETPHKLEKRYLHADGHIVWASIYPSLVRDLDGHPLCFVTHIEDITERKRAEQALRDSEQRMKLARASARIGIFEHDIRTDELTAEEELFRLYGRQKITSTFGVDTWRQALHPEDADRVWKEYQSGLKSDRPFDLDFRIKRPDGTIRHVRSSCMVFRDVEERPARVIGISRDVTDERQLEEHRQRLASRVEEDRRWLEAVLDQMPIPLLLIDLETGCATFANHASDAIAGGRFPLGPVREELPRRFRVTDERARELPIDQWATIRASRGEKVEGQMDVLYSPAGRFSVLANGKTLPAAHDHPATVVFTYQIVNDLVHAIRLRDEFVSIASHELRTPLASLKMQVQMREQALARGNLSAFTPEALVRATERDMRQIDRLTRLVNDMLDVSRISSGRLPLTIDQPVDIVALVHEVLENSAPALAAAGCQVTMDAPAALVGRWDRERIEQLVLNLLTNAWKYGRGKPIHLEVRGMGDRAVLSVRDEGFGIAPCDQKRIFEAFERAVSKDKVSGLGLGLYIGRCVVEAHGGSIRVESELGRGATFTVELPIDPAARPGVGA
jgi:PAS domain S-box-containing protein